MPVQRIQRWAAALGLAMSVSLAHSQMDPELAAKLRAIGAVVNPPATSPLYVPRMQDREPYAGVKVTRDIVYGGQERNLLDVFVPLEAAAAPRTVFMFVHGGAFQRGDRRSAPGSPFYDNVMMWAARQGMVGVNLTYRLAPKYTWPAGAEDLAQAVRWVHQNIASHGGNPARVFLMGHSAGAIHVATYLAQEQFQQVPGSGVVGALMLSALYDFTPELMAREPINKAYYGEDPSKWAERSARAGLLKTRVPLWLAYGELDPPTFVSEAETMNKALCEAGRCPVFFRFAGHSHMSEIFSINSDDQQISDAMLAFVKAH